MLVRKHLLVDVTEDTTDTHYEEDAVEVIETEQVHER